MEDRILTVNLIAGIAAFVSVVPVLLLLSVKTIPEYSKWTGRLAGLFKVRTLSFAAAAGGAAGVGSAFLTSLVNAYVSPDIELAARPSEALTWTIQIAFLNAGLVEEVVKCLVAVVLVSVLARNTGGRQEHRGLFLGATPFLCGAVGMGFALIENFYYIRGAPQGVPTMIFVRGLLPVHTIINFNFGLSLLAVRGRNFAAVFLTALAVAVLQHGIFDFFALPSGGFSTFLTLLTALLLVAYVLGRMYKLLPETRFHSWRPKADADEEGSAEESPWQLSPTALAFLERGLLRDDHRQVRPALQSPPFPEGEFPFPSPEVREAFLRYEFAAPPPAAEKEYREFFEAKAREAFAPAPVYVWDTAVFAEDIHRGDELVRELGSLGVDLTAMAPLRVLEFSPTGGLPGAYRYLSCGLGPLLGRELFVSFPHPFSLARLLFTAAASGLFSEPLEDFQPSAVPPHLLGDPRGWFRGLMPVPLLDPARERLAVAFDGRCPLPAEILYLSRPDLRFIRRFGVQNYFGVLKEAGVPWFNDFLRIPLEVEEQDARSSRPNGSEREG